MVKRILVTLIILCPWLSLAANNSSDNLELRLNYNDLSTKETELNERLKEQDTNRMVKKYSTEGLLKIEKVVPENSMQNGNLSTEFDDKNSISVYKRDPTVKKDHGIGLKINVPLTNDK